MSKLVNQESSFFEQQAQPQEGMLPEQQLSPEDMAKRELIFQVARTAMEMCDISYIEKHMEQTRRADTARFLKELQQTEAPPVDRQKISKWMREMYGNPEHS